MSSGSRRRHGKAAKVALKRQFDRLLSCRYGHLICATARRRKTESDFETGRIIQHFDPRFVKPRDGSDQAQPQAVSRRVSTVFDAVKALENMLPLIGGNSGPVVGDRDDRPAIEVFVR